MSVMSYNAPVQEDEWDALLRRKQYWNTLRVAVWALRFVKNCKVQKRGEKLEGPMTTEEIHKARDHFIVRAQRNISETLQKPGWALESPKLLNVWV